MNVLDFSYVGLQGSVLLAAVLIYLTATAVSCCVSQKRFETIDL